MLLESLNFAGISVPGRSLMLLEAHQCYWKNFSVASDVVVTGRLLVLLVLVLLESY